MNKDILDIIAKSIAELQMRTEVNEIRIDQILELMKRLINVIGANK